MITKDLNNLKPTDSMASLHILAAAAEYISIYQYRNQNTAARLTERTADNTLSEMPNEILIGIITSLYETSPDGTTSCAAPLDALSKTNKHFRALSMPSIFQHVTVTEAFGVACNRNEGVSGVHGSRQVSSSFFVGTHTRS